MQSPNPKSLLFTKSCSPTMCLSTVAHGVWKISWKFPNCKLSDTGCFKILQKWITMYRVFHYIILLLYSIGDFTLVHYQIGAFWTHSHQCQSKSGGFPFANYWTLNFWVYRSVCPQYKFWSHLAFWNMFFCPWDVLSLRFPPIQGGWLTTSIIMPSPLPSRASIWSTEGGF